MLGTGHRLLHNVIIGAKNAGIRLGFGHTREQGGMNQAAGGCLVANNTIVGAGTVGIWLGSAPGGSQGIAVRPIAPYDNRVLNNIISGAVGVLLNVDRSPDNEVDHNMLFAMGTAQVGDSGENAILENPRFADERAGDFRLNPDSPAIEAGVSLEPSGGTANIGASGKAVETWEERFQY